MGGVVQIILNLSDLWEDIAGPLEGTRLGTIDTIESATTGA
ncbi:hypothetical protein ROLI_020010 [Roseobacter fucihabitans]|uniref:Uncharacterized protein n=1 Tax=Roseobacter fucihabitans TaxID=1537242 RepID=A0ABZ2BSE7_9RHOB|nr:hypothetical protein [Roseobacter litoralis]